MTKPLERRRLEEYGTVLDEDDTRALLRVGEKKLRTLLKEGRLRRLAYSQRDILFSSHELRRFLRAETERDLADTCAEEVGAA